MTFNWYYTIVIVAITCLVSLAAFSNENLMNRLILWPRRMDSPAEYYRLLTSGFIHADLFHLLFNMYALYLFGSVVQMTFAINHNAAEIYILLYLSSIVISSLPSYLKNRNNSYYRSLGASGGVAAIIFFTIYYYPWNGVMIFPIPFYIPGVVVGVVYLASEIFLSKRGVSNVNHDAHIWGSVYGLFFAFMVDPNHGSLFLETISHPHFDSF